MERIYPVITMKTPLTFNSLAALWTVLLLFAGGVYAEDRSPVLLRNPAVSQTQIAFSYAGCIWTANHQGGDLHQLTVGGHEGHPKFSPDGSQIAFTGDYDGTRGVYVMPATGGVPRRLTYHLADIDVLGWTADGKSILFSSRRATYIHNAVQLFLVPAEGGFARPVPLDRAVDGALSSDGSHIAFMPFAQSQSAWKHYRGGQTTPIWIANLTDSGVETVIPRDNSNDFNPMWVGDTLYFLSDRSGPVTLFAYDLKSRQVRQLLKNEGFDLKSASASPDNIIYEQFGSLHLLDLQSGVDHPLDIRPSADLAEVRPHYQKIKTTQLRSAAISPTGALAAFGVHGEILTVPEKRGAIGNLTNTPGTMERDPAWSPDGKSIAYLSDESGEYALHVRELGGSGAVRKLNLGDPPAFPYSPTWSPDSKKIGYTDSRLNYWYIDLDKQKPVRVDTDLSVDPTVPDSQNPAHGRRLTWSPDSRWIAYTRQLPNHLHALFIYSLEQARSYQLTDGMSDAFYPAFDKSGEYLYFTASTDVGLTTAWWDLTSLQRPVTRSVYAILLRKDSPYPLDDRSPRDTNSTTVSLDLDGIRQRILALPIPARNYYGLFAGEPGRIFLVEGPDLDPISFFTGDDNIDTKVQRFDLKTRRVVQILDGVSFFTSNGVNSNGLSAFQLSFDSKKMLFAKQNQWFIVSVDKADDDSANPPLELNAMEIYVDPRVEWSHMYEQVWRDERDFFLDPALYGLNLETTRQRYRPFLKNLATRSDLNYLFVEMLGNLTSSHVYVSGGDIPPARRVNVGLLGADYVVDQGRYRISRVYTGESWNPDLQAPLTSPGQSVVAGDYLLAVNGREARPSVDVYSYFAETVGKPVVLTVGPRADGSQSRQVTVAPIADELPLRNAAWIEHNRATVDALTGGRVAYVYLPDTFDQGYRAFNRYYFAQIDKQAAIIDGRFNGGGDYADYIIDYLRRPLMGHMHMRNGSDTTWPFEGIFGPKVMLTNEMAGSGGDFLPYAFREAGIGPLVGTRTWGGANGFASTPDDLLDGGFVSTPDLASYDLRGQWPVENRGVVPDFDVEADPKALRAGHDPQLEKAVEVVLELLKQHPAPPPGVHPPFPNYHSGNP